MGQDPPLSPDEFHARIFAELIRLTTEGVPRPELMVVAGDLTAAGSRKEMAAALTFLTGLRALAGLEPQRVILVPAARDVNLAACEACFNDRKADVACAVSYLRQPSPTKRVCGVSAGP
jgi:hypothetical protein